MQANISAYKYNKSKKTVTSRVQRARWTPSTYDANSTKVPEMKLLGPLTERTPRGESRQTWRPHSENADKRETAHQASKVAQQMWVLPSPWPESGFLWSSSSKERQPPNICFLTFTHVLWWDCSYTLSHKINSKCKTERSSTLVLRDKVSLKMGEKCFSNTEGKMLFV